MDEIRKSLAPFIDWIPADIRGLLSAEVWCLILLVAALIVLLVLFRLAQGLRQSLFGKAPTKVDWDAHLRVNLEECPLPVRPPGERVLLAYHLPVRMRLVVVAPGSKDMEIDATAVEALLERLVPGLGAVMANDRPTIRVWPAQLSHHGFINSFHRCMLKRERDGEPSRWVLLAGKAMLARQPVLLGLGLWAGEPNALGRVNLAPQQWLDVLRLRASGEVH